MITAAQKMRLAVRIRKRNKIIKILIILTMYGKSKFLTKYGLVSRLFLFYIPTVCFFVFFPINVNFVIFAQTLNDTRSELNSQIDELSRQVAEYQKEIEAAKKREKTLNNELWIIGQEVKKINLEIKETNLVINGLEMEIDDANDKIVKIDEKIGRQKILIAGAIRNIYENGDKSFLEIILSQSEIADFFEEMKALEDTQKSLKESLDAIKSLKIDLNNEIEVFEEKREDFSQTKLLQEFQKKTLGQKNKENDQLLRETQGKESVYQNLVKEKQQDIKAIRQRLYLLEGSGVSMTLEEALKYAESVSKSTGIRPAFLLGLLKVESQWGGNTGSGNWKDDMYECYLRLAKYYPNQKDRYTKRAELEKQAFMKITNELGLNPDTVFVSKEPYYGCGGAMGPAQFIATTWLSYRDKVAALTGHNPPSPWNIEDSFTAAAIKLTNDGAAKQTYNAEWKAAMIYLAGGGWNKPQYRFYGDKVMELAEAIQRELDLIKGN